MVEVIGSTPIFSTKSPQRAFFMSFYIYIIYSPATDRYYVGESDNLEKRITSHNSGVSRYTSIAKDWKVVYTEEYTTRAQSISREREIKRKKSRKYIEWLVNNKPV
jgi:putative endonuclease